MAVAAADEAVTARPGLGDELEALLDHLARTGLRIGPRERVAVSALVASLAASGGARSLGDLGPMLAPLLARSPEERRTYARVLAAYAPETAVLDEADAEAPVTPELPAARPWWLPFVLLAAVALAVGVLVWQWPRAKPPEAPKQETKPIAAPAPVSPVAPIVAAPRPTTFPSLTRIEKAAERFEGAPTLGELARELAKASPIGWAATGYEVRLKELTGLPASAPIGLYLGKGAAWARLALALERIEQPGREARLEELAAAATTSLAGGTPGAVYEIAAQLPGWIKDHRHETILPEASARLEQQIGYADCERKCSKDANCKAIEYLGKQKSCLFHSEVKLADEASQFDDSPPRGEVVDYLRQRYHQKRTGRDEQPSAIDAVDGQTILRALAIVPDARVRRVFADAPWSPPPSNIDNTAAWWTPWAALLVPLVLAVIWLANSLALRKAYLRRRPPELPPLHVDLVADAPTKVTYPAALFRRIAQRLQRRTARPTGEIDATATVHASIRAGGELIVPVVAETRRAPEYLVLIERRTEGDQDAARLRDLVRRLEAIVPIVVGYIHGEPSVIEPEGAARAQPIERLQAQYADHRLLILGSGVGFLDPATLSPHPSALQLTHWTERALLTPLPLAEWGREELALAAGLDMAVGRATPEGLLAIAEAIARDADDEPTPLPDTRADGFARPLPAVLRTRPQRFLYGIPPSDLPVLQLVQELRNFLDGPSFEWLAALAVYPAVQWDLTLYLGVTLEGSPGPDGRAAPLYREDRIAALTQLPWLREGHMPAWLRRALIAELPPARAAGIRAALQRLIAAAELADGRHLDETVRLRISREGTAPGEVMDDEVFVDFLANGRIEDFALPPIPLIERLIPRGLLDRIGVPELAAGLVAAAYAAAAWWLAPKPADGGLVAGAWLPLAALAVGGIVALALSAPWEAYRMARAAAVRLGVWGLAWALLVIAAVAFLGADWLVRSAGVGRVVADVVVWIVALAVGGAAIAAAENASRRRRGEAPLSGLRLAWRSAGFAPVGPGIAALAFVATAILGEYDLPDWAGNDLVWSSLLAAIALLAALFFLAWRRIRALTRAGMWNALASLVGFSLAACLVVAALAVAFAMTRSDVGLAMLFEPKLTLHALTAGAGLAIISADRWASQRLRIVRLRLLGSPMKIFAGLLGSLLLAVTLTAIAAAGDQSIWIYGAPGIGLFALAFVASRLLPARLPPPRPAPRDRRRLWSLGGGALQASVALLPILPALWLAHVIATQDQKLAPMPGGVTASAETTDGSHLALGGEDGRVLVYARKSGRLEPRPMQITPQAATGPVTSLALRFEADDTTRPLIVAVATADGTVRLYDGKGGSPRALPPLLRDARSAAAPPLVALTVDGHPLVAIEAADGTTRLVSSGGSSALGSGGPVTALAAAGKGFVLATLDGRLHLVETPADAPPRLARTPAEAPRLPGRARTIEALAGGRIAAIGDDGRLLLARIDGDALTDVQLADLALSAMSLGPAVPWSRAAPAASVAAAPPGTPAKGAPPAPSGAFHVVPVFFGTDRAQVRQADRIGYSNDRANRLAFGRALVSVPLDHKVPSIERPRVWSIPYVGAIQLEKEDRDRHFTVSEIDALTKQELQQYTRQRLSASLAYNNQALVFIHGYNTSFTDALFRAAQLAYDLQFDGAMYLYSWPSVGGLASYIYDRDSAQSAEPYLYEFLAMVLNETGSTSINIIAHGMGNQMLLQVLRSLKLRAPAPMARINQIILASPDVDRDAFEALAAEITGVAKGITLYAASNDRALQASRIVAGNKPRAGDVPEGGPIIVPGIDTIDITGISTDYLALNHSGYAERSDLLQDIARKLRTGESPPDRRSASFRRVETPKGTYWRYER